MPLQVSENLEAAKTLLDCLKEKNLRQFDRSWCYSNGTHRLRNKRALTPVIGLLTDNGWLKEIDNSKRTSISKAKKIYRLTTNAMRELGMR